MKNASTIQFQRIDGSKIWGLFFLFMLTKKLILDRKVCKFNTWFQIDFHE